MFTYFPTLPHTYLPLDLDHLAVPLRLRWPFYRGVGGGAGGGGGRGKLDRLKIAGRGPENWLLPARLFEPKGQVTGRSADSGSLAPDS